MCITNIFSDIWYCLEKTLLNEWWHRPNRVEATTDYKQHQTAAEPGKCYTNIDFLDPSTAMAVNAQQNDAVPHMHGVLRDRLRQSATTAGKEINLGK